MSVIVGLTGQSGAGKTTVSDVFAKNGFGIVNCDNVARNVTSDNSPCNRKLAEIFPDCFDEGYTIDRKKISHIIFSDRKMLKKFDDIVYPFITADIMTEINRLSNEYRFILLDAPTLFEAGADKLCQTIVCVTADYEKRISRILQRDNISRELAEKRISSQHDLQFFTQHCQYIIENNSSQEQVEKKTGEIINIIKERFNG